ncbi:MAG: hypothetical protein OXI26_03905, partial [bacterium]|nr:hypothetical protein [bacterium]
WPEACEQMTDELWRLDLYSLAEVGPDLASHFGELANVVCGGYTHDLGDLCGGIDFLEAGADALGTSLEAFGAMFEALGAGLGAFGEGLGGLAEGLGGVLEGVFSIFG